jgi:hypothetical protein
MPDRTDHRSVTEDVTAMASNVVLGRSDLRSATSPQLLEVVALAWSIHEAARVGLDAAVRHARERGCTWTEIGQALGVTRQAAYRRFGRSTSDEQ